MGIKETFAKQELDKRMIQRKLLLGELKEEDLKEYLAILPDLSEYAEEIELEEP
ncbi:MAG: hypothetical protein N2317_07560 [Syntrophales bacterium]|nr:hypothetical protein [Syntrophales bacterium]